MNSRQSLAAPLIAALALVLLPASVYVATYYLGCDYSEGNYRADGNVQRLIVRRYRSPWLRIALEPASKVESAARGHEVLIPDNFYD